MRAIGITVLPFLAQGGHEHLYLLNGPASAGRHADQPCIVPASAKPRSPVGCEFRERGTTCVMAYRSNRDALVL